MFSIVCLHSIMLPSIFFAMPVAACTNDFIRDSRQKRFFTKQYIMGKKLESCQSYKLEKTMNTEIKWDYAH